MWTTVQRYEEAEDSARIKAEQELGQNRPARDQEPREKGRSAFDQFNKGRLELKVDESQFVPLTKSRIDVLSLNKDVLQPPPPLQAPAHKCNKTMWCDFHNDHSHRTE